MEGIAEFNAANLCKAQQIYEVTIGATPISLEEFIAISRYDAKVVFSQEYIERVTRSSTLARKFLDEGKIVYGLDTGFGDNVRKIIPKEQAIQLQYNIVRSHAVSVGKPLDKESVRAVWMMQLLSLGMGYSGIRIQTLEQIKECLNRGVYPYVPGEGSVQYLAIEAQTNLVIFGEGRAWLDGKVVSGDKALNTANLTPIKPSYKECLCLTNGANATTALAALALYDDAVAVQTSDIAAAMSYEALRGNLLACDPRLMSLKVHPNQRTVARNILHLLDDSMIAAKYKGVSVQDPLVLRSVPQMHGTVKSIIGDAATDILEEMVSCSDNPILWSDEKEERGLMGANCDGMYAASAADTLCIAAANLGKLVERRIDKLTNWHFSGYPAFLADHPGVESCYMIVQYTAAGLVNEIRGLCLPATVDSVPTCANWEDPVSMAWWASRKSCMVAKKMQYIQAIELMVLCRAFDLTDNKIEGSFSKATKAVHDLIRESVPPIHGDRHFGPDIESTYKLLKNCEILKTAESIVGPLEF